MTVLADDTTVWGNTEGADTFTGTNTADLTFHASFQSKPPQIRAPFQTLFTFPDQLRFAHVPSNDFRIMRYWLARPLVR